MGKSKKYADITKLGSYVELHKDLHYLDFYTLAKEPPVYSSLTKPELLLSVGLANHPTVKQDVLTARINLGIKFLNNSFNNSTDLFSTYLSNSALRGGQKGNSLDEEISKLLNKYSLDDYWYIPLAFYIMSDNFAVPKGRMPLTANFPYNELNGYKNNEAKIYAELISRDSLKYPTMVIKQPPSSERELKQWVSSWYSLVEKSKFKNLKNPYENLEPKRFLMSMYIWRCQEYLNMSNSSILKKIQKAQDKDNSVLSPISTISEVSSRKGEAKTYLRKIHRF